MKCPSCHTEIQSPNITFCTSCGKRLHALDARKTAFKQASIMLVIGLVMIPVWMFIGAAFPADDKFVESSPSTTWPEMVAWILMWIMFIASAARVGYSLVFDSTDGRDDSKTTKTAPALHSADTFGPVSPGGWRVTNDDLQKKTLVTQDCRS